MKLIEQNKAAWWYPTKADDAWFARLRKDYPENADWSNERLHDHYGDDAKYPILWDHIGDAYEQYDPLVDAFFAMEDALLAAVEALKEIATMLDGEPDYHDEGMGCGLEDRCITDRYEAMSFGWEQAMERVYSEHINDALELANKALEAGQ